MLVGAAFVLIAGPADAQLRPNTPPVLQPPPQQRTDFNAIVDRFQSTYTARNRPRMVVFWNRDFSDNVATTYEDQSSSVTRSKGGETETNETVNTQTGQSSLRELDTAREEQTQNRSRTVVVGPQQRSANLNETVEWRLETAFTNLLLAGSVRLVDRATIIRTSDGAISSTARPNLQAIETSSIKGKADLILEVLMSRDARSPTQFSYRVDVKSVDTGEIISRFVTTAMPRDAGQSYYVAGQNGFTRQTAPVSVEDVANELALEIMERLTAAWQRG